MRWRLPMTAHPLPPAGCSPTAISAAWPCSKRHVARALALMAKAAELGYPELILNAQTHAEPFYARAGFERCGDEFEEAGIPHIEMRKRLV